LAGGFGSPDNKAKVMAMPGWAQTREFGKVGREELPSILSQSVAGLVLFLPVPNHVDAQPNKIFEYMSAGIPVIGSNFPLWKEIIEGNACGICVDPFDVVAISRAILWLADHPEEARRMGENGRKAVCDKYNWEIESIRLISFYSELETCAE
jgi:glycosyltransferase involved in cell wall biosynthesis